MILQIEIPEEFEDDFNTNRFKDFFGRCNEVMEYFNDKSNMLMDAFENATTWTPVTEKLPDKDGEYLVSVDRETVTIVSYADGWNCVREGDKVDRSYEVTFVKAWMPLPKSDKGEKNETD